MKTPTRKLLVEKLEDRCVPAAFGNPWLDGAHLTMSFAPDGALINGSPSALSKSLSPLGQSAAQMEILRAFQSWAVHANLNVGLVGDGGQDFNSGGAIQNDPRFGDIRVGATVLPNDVLAVTAPFNLFSTFSGNVVLNSAAAGKSDLFTVFLQEAGHAFSVGNNTNKESAMYETYLGARSGLSAADVAAIQSLYGARTADEFEGSNGNGTITTAFKYSEAVEADVTNLTDVDCYRFTTPFLTFGTTISLKSAGLSLLAAKVEVLDASGNVVATKSALDPTDNDITLNLSNLKGSSTYFVRVSSARSDVFGIGSYRLSINPNSILDAASGAVSYLSTELGLNDVLSNATGLIQKVTTASSQIDYSVRGTLITASDLDYYQFRAPGAAPGTSLNMVATVWGLNGNSLDPRLTVYDSAGNVVAAQVLTNDRGAYTIQVLNATPNATYYLRVSSDTDRVGNYSVAVDFTAKPVAFSLGSSGTLTSASSQSQAALKVSRSQQVHFVFGSVPGAPAKTELVLTLTNSSGVVVYQFVTPANDARSVDVFLTDGTYTVKVAARSTNNTALRAIEYYLKAVGITDPVGAVRVDATSAPEGGSSSGGNSNPPPEDSDAEVYWQSQYPCDGTYWY